MKFTREPGDPSVMKMRSRDVRSQLRRPVWQKYEAPSPLLTPTSVGFEITLHPTPGWPFVDGGHDAAEGACEEGAGATMWNEQWRSMTFVTRMCRAVNPTPLLERLLASQPKISFHHIASPVSVWICTAWLKCEFFLFFNGAIAQADVLIETKKSINNWSSSTHPNILPWHQCAAKRYWNIMFV